MVENFIDVIKELLSDARDCYAKENTRSNSNENIYIARYMKLDHVTDMIKELHSNARDSYEKIDTRSNSNENICIARCL